MKADPQGCITLKFSEVLANDFAQNTIVKKSMPYGTTDAEAPMPQHGERLHKDITHHSSLVIIQNIRSM